LQKGKFNNQLVEVIKYFLFVVEISLIHKYPVSEINQILDFVLIYLI